MRTAISRWFLFGLLLGWSLTHASVFAQVAVQPGIVQPDIARPPFVVIKSTPMSPDKLRAGLDKTVTIDYTGQSLTDVINHFRDRTGLNITLDQMILQMGVNPDDNIGQLQVKATNEKAGQALRRFLNTYQLCYILLEDSILVTTEDMASFRQMRQRVSVDLDNVPLQKAMRDIAKKHGVNLVIDPKVLKQCEAPVSLHLENTGIDTTVRLLAELGSLKVARMGNVMFITSEDKAKKLREEEQFDNPRIGPGPYPYAGPIPGQFGAVPMAAPRFVAPGQIQADPAVPPPPPGIELPPANDTPAPISPPVRKKVIDVRPDGSAPFERPAVDRPQAPPVPLPPRSDN